MIPPKSVFFSPRLKRTRPPVPIVAITEQSTEQRIFPRHTPRRSGHCVAVLICYFVEAPGRRLTATQGHPSRRRLPATPRRPISPVKPSHSATPVPRPREQPSAGEGGGGILRAPQATAAPAVLSMGRDGQAPVREAEHIRSALPSSTPSNCASPRPPSSRGLPSLPRGRLPFGRQILSLPQRPSARRPPTPVPAAAGPSIGSDPVWPSTRSSTGLRGLSSSSDGN
ncbi:hypothetical protein PVAP13_1NG167119 [Panicum virgatum]|uniref:Uncharacterized protein n=1 Tax=Panicum virgatum TaxID=38727 RepID=A0A8T0X0D1_PANVG|nr:hypothetical protein PVAP13_1NG167119 [Panicum virgatum]